MEFTTTAAADAGIGAPFWRISSERGQIHLLGSLHFGREDFYPLASDIMRVFAAADVLVVEFDILALDLYTSSRLLAEKGLYTTGGGLRSVVSPATWHALSAAAAERSIPLALLQMQKPWMAVITLSAAELVRLGYREDLGIDRHFLQQAHAADMEIIELESLSQQLELLDGLPLIAQQAMLRQTLRDMSRSKEYFEQLLLTWKSADSSGLDRMLNEAFATTEEEGGDVVYQRLIVERNHAMATQLVGMLARGGDYFVVLGAGHLGGEQGLLRLLDAAGYPGQPVTAATP